jgi:hypothetical protein
MLVDLKAPDSSALSQGNHALPAPPLMKIGSGLNSIFMAVFRKQLFGPGLEGMPPSLRHRRGSDLRTVWVCGSPARRRWPAEPMRPRPVPGLTLRNHAHQVSKCDQFLTKHTRLHQHTLHSVIDGTAEVGQYTIRKCIRESPDPAELHSRGNVKSCSR